VYDVSTSAADHHGLEQVSIINWNECPPSIGTGVHFHRNTHPGEGQRSAPDDEHDHIGIKAPGTDNPTPPAIANGSCLQRGNNRPLLPFLLANQANAFYSKPPN
jgi:hypothetical protein